MNASEKTIANKIKAIRKAKKITLAELSEKTGISEVTLGKMERHQGMPKISIISSICIALESKLVLRIEAINH